MAEEDIIQEQYQERFKEEVKIKKSEAVLDRLLADTEVRRYQKERIIQENPNNFNEPLDI